MRKLAYQLGDDLYEEAPPRRRWLRLGLILLLVVGLFPLVLDGASLCLGHWKEYFGISADVRTPTLDRVGETLDDLNRVVWGQITPWFQALPWTPRMVIPMGLITMAAAMMMLRR
ncbi:MAG: hypothetical protein U0790_07355 [Isosphaeraceae bacterium]